MTNKQAEILLRELSKKCEFWRTNTVDPHQVGSAVWVALMEVMEAVKVAIDKPKKKKKL